MSALINRIALEAIMGIIECADNGMGFHDTGKSIIVLDTQVVDVTSTEFRSWVKAGADTENVPENLEGGILGVVGCRNENIEVVIALDGGCVEDVYSTVPLDYRVADYDLSEVGDSDITVFISGRDAALGRKFPACTIPAIVEHSNTTWETLEG